MLRPGDLDQAAVLGLAAAAATGSAAGVLLGLAPLAAAGCCGAAARVARRVQRETVLPGLLGILATLLLGIIGGVISSLAVRVVIWALMHRGYLDPPADITDLVVVTSFVGGYYADYLFDGGEKIAAKWKRDPLRAVDEIRGRSRAGGGDSDA